MAGKKNCYTFSKWETFSTCPRQYQAKYVTKEVQFVQGPEAVYGDEVHDALENAVQHGTPLPKRFQRYAKFLRAAESLGGHMVAEGKVAVDDQWQPVDYYSHAARWRSKIDLSVYDPEFTQAVLWDWKTGKRREKPDQLHLYGLMSFHLHPSLQKIQSGFVWLKDGLVGPPITYTRDQVQAMQKRWDERAQILDRAEEVDNFVCKPSGLCNGWCDVDTCKFWKPKRN